MTVIKLSFGQNPYIGAFLRVTDSFALIPDTTTKTAEEKIKDTLNVDTYKITLNGSRLLGVFAVANSHGILVPHFVDDMQISELKKLIGVPVVRLPSQFTSLGNLVLVNDKHAICTPSFEEKAIDIISSTLNVDVHIQKIVSSELVGTVAVVTNKGLLVHPLADDKELERISKIMGVPAQIGTANLGSPYVAIGVVANSFGAIVGGLTTGPEIARISETLMV